MCSTEIGVLLRSVSPARHAGFVTLLSALSLLSLSALGLASSFYRLYYDIASPGGCGLVVSSYSVSPITSVVERGYVEGLVGDSAGVSVEFAVFSPVLIGGRTAVVRGLEAEGLRELLGRELPSEYCVIVGRGLAGDLGLEVGSVVPLHSILTGRVLLVHVCGVADLPRPYGFELLGGVGLARELRGLPSGAYSIAVVRSEDLGALQSLAARLGLPPEGASLLGRAILVLTQGGGRVPPEVRRELPEVYISRLGLHRDFLYYFAYSVAAVSVLCLPIVGEAVVRAARGPASAMRLLGVSRLRVSLALGATALAYAALALALAALAGGPLGGFVALRVLGYAVVPELGAGEVAAVSVLQTALLMLGVAWGVREHVE